jgi:hypothetical protein
MLHARRSRGLPMNHPPISEPSSKPSPTDRTDMPRASTPRCLAPARCIFWRLNLLLGLSLLAACGGGSGGASGEGAALGSGQAGIVVTDGASTTTPSTPGATRPPVVLPPPMLSFSDTGVSVSDGITFNGKWSVAALLDGLGWEYSLDMGRTWIRGEGDGFEVSGDGRKTIWVRSFDQQGNTSEIVMTSCTLDTTAPTAPQVAVAEGASLPTVTLAGLEPMATWEYSVDDQATWNPGRGTTLSFAGNAIRRVWTRQVDAAGNASPAVATLLDAPGSPGWVEFSGMPMMPSALPRWSGTLVLHGEVSKPDTDFVRFEVPTGQRLRALRLVHYASPDPIAFYALQRGAVFDAGTDVQRMTAWKHLGPGDRSVNLMAGVDAAALGAGLHVLWINQTGTDLTRYAIEIEIGDP